MLRRPELADVMLLATVSLWALNFTITKYVISRGFQPVACGVLRFDAPGIVFSAAAWIRNRSFALRRRDCCWNALGGAVILDGSYRK